MVYGVAIENGNGGLQKFKNSDRFLGCTGVLDFTAVEFGSFKANRASRGRVAAKERLDFFIGQ